MGVKRCDTGVETQPALPRRSFLKKAYRVPVLASLGTLAITPRGAAASCLGDPLGCPPDTPDLETLTMTQSAETIESNAMTSVSETWDDNKLQ